MSQPQSIKHCFISETLLSLIRICFLNYKCANILLYRAKTKFIA